MKDELDRIATDTKRNKSVVAGEAVLADVIPELEIFRGIKRGLAEAEAGQVISHAQAVAEIREVIENAKRRKTAGA